MPRMNSFRSGTKNSRMVEAQYRICIFCFCPPRISPKENGWSKRRIPPQTHFCPRIFAFRSATLSEYLEGRTPKEKHPFLFQKKFTPRQIRNARSVFLSGFPPSPRGGGGAIRRAYDSGQSHHALRACLIRGSAGNESELFGIMTTFLNLKKD